MAEIKEFVVNDRRKFTAEGDARPDAPPSEPKAPRPETIQPTAPPPDEFNSSARLTTNGPQAVPNPTNAGAPGPDSRTRDSDFEAQPDMPPPPTEEQTGQAKSAYDATVDRLDTAIRASNPGMERMPEMTFDRLVQSVYMQAIIQLGGAAEPGTTPQIDLLGARQSIDMLSVLADKTKGNLSEAENSLLQSALFEARMGFLEMTQLLARQAAAKQGAPPLPGAPSGPSIVR
jgi:hypothetical protein